MAETAKLIKPNKVVLEPESNTGYSLYKSFLLEAFPPYKAKYPDHLVLSYINHCGGKIDEQHFLYFIEWIASDYVYSKRQKHFVRSG